MTRFQAGDIKGTEAYLKGLIAGGANDEVAEELYESLVKGYLSEFRLHEALVCLNHWIEWRPREVQPRVWRAELWVQIKDWNKAAKEYEGILELEPAHRSARHGLAEAMLSQNRVQEANEQYQQLYAQTPDDPVTWIGLAHCERRLGNLDAANPWLERACKRNCRINSVRML